MSIPNGSHHDISDLILSLEALGVRLWEEAGQIHFEAPKGVLLPETLRQLKENRDAALAWLQQRVAVITQPDESQRYAAFPLTDVQSAYLLGRSDVFGLGDVACHAYLELEYPDLIAAAVENAWNMLIARHDMLRAVFSADGTQVVKPAAPQLHVLARDLRAGAEDEVHARLSEWREEMGHKQYDLGTWPMFEVRVSQLSGRVLLHLSIDFVVADWVSISMLLREFEEVCLKTAVDSARRPSIQFRDYVLAERKLRGSAQYDRDRQYWLARVDHLPSAPRLPLQDMTKVAPRFLRHALHLSPKDWSGFRREAVRRGLTASSAVLAAYAAVLERWSETSHFSLNLTLLNRLPLHPDVDRLIGDFTSVSLLEVDWQHGATFAAAAGMLARQLFEDMDHRTFSGIEVLREMARRRGREDARMPIVFTSAIGLGDRYGSGGSIGKIAYGITQTPQVYIDCQAMDNEFGLYINWDVREGVFPSGLTEDMFTAFETLLRALAGTSQSWDRVCSIALPQWQIQERRIVNDTAAPLTEVLLHQGVLDQVQRTPGRIAVVDGEREISYEQLVRDAQRIAQELHRLGCADEETVAIYMAKGYEQIAAVLGTLLAGCTYLPIDTAQPPLRRDAMLTVASVRIVLSHSKVSAAVEWPASVSLVAVDSVIGAHTGRAFDARSSARPDSAAYIIFTSGSTGIPKGVVVSHRAAWNTVSDINRRFKLDGRDRMLALSSLGFDLSVFDIFGPLSVGGTVVLTTEDRRNDPSHWAQQIRQHRITLWNTVPALMQMLVGYLDTYPNQQEDSVRLVLLSGDWIPTSLPDQIGEHFANADVISLGGATEAAIWSIWHRCENQPTGWPSVPYGTPLKNQHFRILDHRMRDCPVWGRGSLLIGGAGLASGYLKDEALTADRFINAPDSGERLYATGDKARYRPGGLIEFLGREDQQVKVRGYRVELQEIEAALQAHSGVAAAAVVLESNDSGQQFIGFAESQRQEPHSLSATRLERLRRIVSSAADREIEGLQPVHVERWAELLDAAALASMMQALLRLGMFPDDSACDPETLLDDARVADKHRWLVRRWFDVLVSAAYLQISPGQEFYSCRRRVTAGEVDTLWATLKAEWLPALGSELFYEYLRQNAASLPEMILGEIDPVSILFPEGKATFTEALYRDNVVARYANRAVSAMLHRIAMEIPDGEVFRILEVGAGTGGTTEGVLRTLSGIPIDYLFTDVAPFFLPEARHRFAAYANVRFGLFDVDRDPRAQGLLPNSFDVVLAAGAIENARNIQDALGSLAELLVPGGWLVLTEPVREFPWVLMSQAFMMMPPEDERSGNAAYLGHDEWLRKIVCAGANDVLVFPERSHVLTPQSVHVFAARMKIDRIPVKPKELSLFLSERLPQYMLPGQIQIVDQMPLTANGKLDRTALRSWASSPVQTVVEMASAEKPKDELERALLEMWSKALGVTSMDRTADFFQLGADSLIAARITGRMREELPEAESLSFDVLLRQVLNSPTIASLGDFLRKRGMASTGSSLPLPIGSLMRFNEPEEGPLQVMFHAGLGTMECYRPLAAELVAQQRGHVVGVVIANTDEYCSLNAAQVIPQLADRYTEYLLREGHTRFQMIGYCLGGMYAVEVARRLLERGLYVEDLVLTSSHPVLFDIQDDLMIETMFVPNLGLTAAQMGFGETDSSERLDAFMHLIKIHNGVVPAGSLAELRGSNGVRRVGEFFRRMADTPQEVRFQYYADTASSLSGNEMKPEMVASLFRTYRQSFRSAFFKPEPYAGDIRFLLPTEGSGFAPGMDEMTLSFWREICLGDFSVSRIPGNHFTCMMDPHVKAVADHIAEPLKGNDRL